MFPSVSSKNVCGILRRLKRTSLVHDASVHILPSSAHEKPCQEKTLPNNSTAASLNSRFNELGIPDRNGFWISRLMLETQNHHTRGVFAARLHEITKWQIVLFPCLKVKDFMVRWERVVCSPSLKSECFHVENPRAVEVFDPNIELLDAELAWWWQAG